MDLMSIDTYKLYRDGDVVIFYNDGIFDLASCNLCDICDQLPAALDFNLFIVSVDKISHLLDTTDITQSQLSKEELIKYNNMSLYEYGHIMSTSARVKETVDEIIGARLCDPSKKCSVLLFAMSMDLEVIVN